MRRTLASTNVEGIRVSWRSLLLLLTLRILSMILYKDRSG
jgi:hypothetical protein